MVAIDLTTEDTEHTEEEQATKLNPRKGLSNGWVVVPFVCFLPFFLLFLPQVWYGEGWGKLGPPFILCAFIAGFGSSIVVMIYGNWKQRLIVLLPFIQYAGLFISPLF